jgi:hypothetical protein
MGNDGRLIIGMSTMGMLGPMGVIMVLGMPSGNLAMGMGVGMGNVGGDLGGFNIAFTT